MSENNGGPYYDPREHTLVHNRHLADLRTRALPKQILFDRDDPAMQRQVSLVQEEAARMAIEVGTARGTLVVTITTPEEAYMLGLAVGARMLEEGKK